MIPDSPMSTKTGTSRRLRSLAQPRDGAPSAAGTQGAAHQSAAATRTGRPCGRRTLVLSVAGSIDRDLAMIFDLAKIMVKPGFYRGFWVILP